MIKVRFDEMCYINSISSLKNSLLMMIEVVRKFVGS